MAVDAAAVVIAVLFASTFCRSVLHPAWMFIGVHIYTVTLRLVQLLNGHIPMRYFFTWPVSTEEVIRASLASDLGLIAMIAGWIWASRFRFGWRPRFDFFDPKTIRNIAVGALIVGTISMLLSHPSGEDLNTSWTTTGYVAATAAWPPFVLCIFYYLYGFTPALIWLGAVIMTLALMFEPRFAVVIPCITIVFIWLVRRGRRTPPLSLLLFAPLILAVWLPLKPFVKQIKEGSTPAGALAYAIDRTHSDFVSDEGSIDSQFLDMIAATMSLSDVHGARFHGASLLPLLVSPVPRILWPNKPMMNQFQWDLDLPSRPLAKIAMTSGLVGEGYADFGYMGVVLYCFFVSTLYCYLFYRLCPRKGETDFSGLLYLALLASAMQVYRDNLISGVWFPLVYEAPIGVVAVINLVAAKLGAPRRLPVENSTYSSRVAPRTRPALVRDASWSK